jgi:hypothetical protein
MKNRENRKEGRTLLEPPYKAIDAEFSSKREREE